MSRAAKFERVLKESTRSGWITVGLIGTMAGTSVLLNAIQPEIDVRSAFAGAVTWTLLWTIVGMAFGLDVRLERWTFKERIQEEQKPEPSNWEDHPLP